MSTVDLSKSELVVLDIHVPGFETVLKAKDINNASDLPPEKVAKLGTIRVVDKKDVSELNAIKRAAERACLLKGVRFIGGFIVANSNGPELIAALDALKDRFEDVTERLKTTRDGLIRSWADANPEWSQLILDGAHRYLARTHEPHFRFTPIQVAAAGSKPEALQHAATMIGSQLLLEIGQEAKEAYENSFRGKNDCTRRALSPLVRMREKLHAMRFASAEAVDVIFDIDQVLGAIPKTGPINGAVFDSLVALVLRLKNGDVRKDAQSPFVGQNGIEHLPDLRMDDVGPPADLPSVVPPASVPVVNPMPAPTEIRQRVISF